MVDSLPKRCLRDNYSISQSLVCIWLLQTQHFDPETLLGDSHSLGGREEFIFPDCRVPFSSSSIHSEWHVAWHRARSPTATNGT